MKYLKALAGVIICQGVCSVSLFAQWDKAIVSNKDSSKFGAGIYGSSDGSSAAITNTFIYNILAGNYLDDNLKNKVSSHLVNTNRIGASLNYGAYAVFYNDTIKKKRVFNIFFALRHKAYINGEFSADDFNLAFFGNAPYAGKTLSLSPLNINYMSYHQAELGIVCTNFGGKAQLGLGVSFLAGQHYDAINVAQGSLYTDTLGQYLTLNSNTKLSETDTAGNAKNRLVNGYGASLDIYFSAPYHIGKKSGIITVSVSDLGFIKWDSRSLTYNKDTSYTYSGITVNGLNDLQNTNINNLSKDSLLNKYLPLKKGTFYTAIPALLSINTNTALGKMNLEVGFDYLFNANALGYFYVQGDKPFSHGWLTALQIGYGGYTTYNAMLVISKKIKKTTVCLNLNHLTSFILPDAEGGAGISIQINHNF